MLGDFGIDEFIAICLELFESALLIRLDQLSIPHHFSS
jgi:hypothetical protein